MSSTSLLKDLRNRSFKGQNLEGADFTNCDLRGADFRGAKLQGSSFSGSTFGQTAQQRTKLISLAVVGAFCIAGTIPIAIVGASYIVGVGTIYLSLTFDFNVATFFAVAISLTLSSAMLIAVATVGFGAFALTFTVAGVLAVSGFSAGAAALLNFGIGSVLKGIIFTIVSIACLFLARILFQSAIDVIKRTPGTLFNNADLTGVTFDNTRLINCDFTNATID